MTVDVGVWDGRQVLVTGHTGFKGSWLVAWLTRMGARVSGLALPPPDGPSLHVLGGLDRQATSLAGDVREPRVVAAAVERAAPEIVFHLAAQPLVLESLRDPVGTFTTNVLGTINVLEAVRRSPVVRAVVVVTSDKCYRDAAALCGEDDPLGGSEPYSASKAAAEIAVAAWRACFLQPERGCGVATARAGNVIGGGDFSPDRLLPDLMRAGEEDGTAVLRHPDAIRPWQHVLDALSGYLTLAQALENDPAAFASSWNFGPPEEGCWTAREVADLALRCLGRGRWRVAGGESRHEAAMLRLAADRARERLGWAPRLSTAEAIEWAVEGYRSLAKDGGHGWLNGQIARYDLSGPPAVPRPHVVPQPNGACHA